VSCFEVGKPVGQAGFEPATAAGRSEFRDVTRQSESYGTEIPVVPENQAIAGAPILLNDIPRDADSRIMLRIYDFDGPTGGKVDLDVSFDDASPDEQFASETIDLPPQRHVAISCPHFWMPIR
jgi:hypothetical protein